MDFGYRELLLVSKLLALLKTDKDFTIRLGNRVTPEFNPNSGHVFLIDSNFNIAMINGDHLEDWFICPTCYFEGFEKDLMNNSSCCKIHAKNKMPFNSAAS